MFSLLQLLPHGSLLFCWAWDALCKPWGLCQIPHKLGALLPTTLPTVVSPQDFGTAELHFAKDLSKAAAVGGGEALTSDIQAVVTGELCKGWHVRGVIGQLVGLLSNAPCSLLDALIVGVLNSWGKKFILIQMSTEVFALIGVRFEDPSLQTEPSPFFRVCKLGHNWGSSQGTAWPHISTSSSRLGFGRLPEFRRIVLKTD